LTEEFVMLDGKKYESAAQDERHLYTVEEQQSMFFWE
jgi:hypothetical protein